MPPQQHPDLEVGHCSFGHPGAIVQHAHPPQPLLEVHPRATVVSTPTHRHGAGQRDLGVGEHFLLRLVLAVGPPRCHSGAGKRRGDGVGAAY